MNIDNKETLETLEQAGEPKPETVLGLHYFYLSGIKNAFVNAFRAAFSDENIPEQFRYNENSQYSQLQIYKNYPQRVNKLPMIIISTSNGDGSFSYLSDEILFEGLEQLDEGYMYGGVLTLEVNIDILTQNIVDMEKLTDIVLILMRYVFREKFQEKNIAFSNLKISGESEEKEDVGKIYKNTITTKVTTDFTNFIPKSLVEKIEKINITVNPYEGEL
jgi:hypothetical protein